MEDPARLLASRVLSETPEQVPLSPAALTAAARRRGCHVVTHASLRRRGYYVRTNLGDLIVCQDPPQPVVIAHELFHHITADNADHGIQYDDEDWIQTDEESAADRFAAYLCEETNPPPDLPKTNR